MPRLPPAPGLFSMMTGWPSRSDKNWPMMRATTSLGPPAGNEMTHLIGRVG